MQLELKCGLKFPFLHKAFQILQSIVPEGELTAEEELLFILRAYGKAITGQNIAIEKVEDALRPPTNILSGYIAYLDYGDSKATLDEMGRKGVAVTQFNDWLIKSKYRILVKPHPEYLRQ